MVYVPARADGSRVMMMVRSNATPSAVAPSIRAEVLALDEDIALNAINATGPGHDGVEMGAPGVRGDVDGFCVRWVAAGSGRALRRDGVCRGSADARNRGSHGSRCAVRALVWLFVKRASLPVGVGIGAGLAGALGLGKLLQRFLIETSPADPAILVGIAVLLAAVSFAAAFFPARRATVSTRSQPAVHKCLKHNAW